MLYEHRQPAPQLVGSYSAMAVMSAGSALYLSLHQPASPIPYLSLSVMAIALGISAAAVGSLSVRVDAHRIMIRFGPGWVHKEIELSTVASAQEVRNPWYFGWGIHYIGGGWLYNVAGREAVELRLKNGGRARIGTDEPAALAAAIRSAIIR